MVGLVQTVKDLVLRDCHRLGAGDSTLHLDEEEVAGDRVSRTDVETRIVSGHLVWLASDLLFGQEHRINSGSLDALSFERTRARLHLAISSQALEQAPGHNKGAANNDRGERGELFLLVELAQPSLET